MSAQDKVVAIVGAAGAVGAEFLTCLARRKFPMKEFRLLASKRSAGKEMAFMGKPLRVQELTEDSFKGVDIALFSAGDQLLKGAALKAVQIAELLAA